MEAPQLYGVPRGGMRKGSGCGQRDGSCADRRPQGPLTSGLPAPLTPQSPSSAATQHLDALSRFLESAGWLTSGRCCLVARFLVEAFGVSDGLPPLSPPLSNRLCVRGMEGPLHHYYLLDMLP